MGWYTTGTKHKPHDIEISEMFRNYCEDPILVLVDIENKDEMSLPTQAYSIYEEVNSEG